MLVLHMSDTVSYTFRMPSDLKRLMESAAKSGGVSLASSITDACWKYLERGSSAVEHRPHKPLVMGSNPIPATIASAKMNGAMANFLSSTIPTHPDSVNTTKDAFLASTPVGEPIEVKWPLCPKTGFNEQDGETYRCSLAKGHKGNCKRGERV